MIEIRKKSALPIYGAALSWAVYALFFPLYRASHFLYIILISLAVYLILSKVIPDSVTYIEKEPEKTGDREVDSLLEFGRNTIREMQNCSQQLNGDPISEKVERLASVTSKIFDFLLEDKSSYSQIKRFSDYFLPAATKLISAYCRLRAQDTRGENITGSMERISEIMDTTVSAYEKQLDALFANKALDIETDITVLESMMKNQGLSESDFDIN